MTIIEGSLVVIALSYAIGAYISIRAIWLQKKAQKLQRESLQQQQIQQEIEKRATEKMTKQQEKKDEPITK